MDQSQHDTTAKLAVSKLAKKYALNEHQSSQFVTYLTMLQEWNKMMNLTAITGTQEIVDTHFDDSLELSKSMDLSTINSLADVGTGAGFPGLALKIMFPHIQVLLIEVVQKKVEFLEAVIKACGIEGIEISGVDWRNFLRYPDYDIQLFVSRAALPTDELVRMFRPSCHYQNSKLVYWASKNWQASPQDMPYKVSEYTYSIAGKDRKLVFFSKGS